MTRPAFKTPPGPADGRLALAELQAWFLAAMTGQWGVDSLPEESADPGIASVVAPSPTLSSEERMEIYQRAYLGRLLEVLREEFSVLYRALGEPLFDQFALEYLRGNPSTSYTLGRLGDRFVSFLEGTRPPADADSNLPAGWEDFLIDLARVERTVNEVFDGPGSEDLAPLDPARLQSLTPVEFASARMPLAPSVQLLQTRFPINDYFSAILRDERLPIPDPARSYMVLSRRDYRVERRVLSSAQFVLLECLGQGETVERALEAAVNQADSDPHSAGPEEFARSLRGWFADWTAAGFFAAVET